MQPYIDEYNPEDQTLAFRAAERGNAYVMTILIEAGVNISKPSSSARWCFLPIQVALLQGTMSSRLSVSNPTRDFGSFGERSLRLGKGALEVAWLLVKEHRAPRSALFHGITKLHLAAYMGLLDMINDITSDSQVDMTAKGTRPGIPDPVSAKELLEHIAGGDGMGLCELEVNLSPVAELCAKRLVDENSCLESTDLETRHFKDWDAIVVEMEDGAEEGSTVLVTISPALIYEHAMSVIRML